MTNENKKSKLGLFDYPEPAADFNNQISEASIDKSAAAYKAQRPDDTEFFRCFDPKGKGNVDDIKKYLTVSVPVKHRKTEYLVAGPPDFLQQDKADFSKVRMIDSQVIFHKKEPRNLSAALKFYCGKNLENAHSALDDTIATYEVFKAQLEKYDDLEPNIDFLSDYTKRSNNLDFAGKIRIDADNDAIFAFGKYTGQKVIDVFKSDKGYYSWIMKGDFPEYTKKIFTKLKLSLINDK